MRDELANADEQELWSIQLAMYQDVLAGDRNAVDARIHPDVTIWDSEYEPMVFGLAAFDVVRDERPSGADAPRLVALDATEPVVRIWGDTAMMAHRLHVRLSDGSEERVRVSAVWRRENGVWRAVHNHEDVRP